MSEEKKGGKGTMAVVLIGCAAAGVIGIVVLGIVAAIAIPNFVSMQYKSKRAEIPTNLKSIKTAQIQYESNFDTYVPVARYPSSPTKTVQQWVVSESGGFEVLNFQPFSDVRGSYWVDVSPDGSNFTARTTSSIWFDRTIHMRLCKCM